MGVREKMGGRLSRPQSQNARRFSVARGYKRGTFARIPLRRSAGWRRVRRFSRRISFFSALLDPRVLQDERIGASHNRIELGRIAAQKGHIGVKCKKETGSGEPPVSKLN
jgi:hypothetical protein